MKFLTQLKVLLALLICLAGASCQMKSVSKKDGADLPRATASAFEEEDSEERHRQTFLTLMNEPDVTRLERVKKFMDRQRAFFFIAYEMLAEFDQKLEGLYQKAQAGEVITAEEFQQFNELRFKNLIAWEFSERNLHEMLDLYQMALESANDKASPYNEKSREIVTKTGKWFSDGYAQGDKGAVIQLAEHFEDVNDLVLAANKKARVPSFKKYTNMSDEKRAKAAAQSLKYALTRKKEAFDYFINKEWNDFRDEKMQQKSSAFPELYDVRTPQALDTLEPDPGPNGHVTGNRFPKGKWALTFDDGPHPTHTQGVLDMLKATGVHATFFWLSQNLIKYSQYAKKAGDAGYSRACHSYSHQNLPTLKPAALNHEVNEALDEFQKIVGKPATLFRCPYGACGGNGSKIRQMIAGRNALEIFWNVDTLDWQDKNPESVFQRAKKQVDVLGRGIILFHDIHPQSVIASKLLVEYIKSKPELKVAPLKDLIGEARGKEYSSP
jgi:peptidoglycan/xylan/chitin deacetylase (PgdA/CDA1 family)